MGADECVYLSPFLIRRRKVHSATTRRAHQGHRLDEIGDGLGKICQTAVGEKLIEAWSEEGDGRVSRK